VTLKELRYLYSIVQCPSIHYSMGSILTPNPKGVYNVHRYLYSASHSISQTEALSIDQAVCDSSTVKRKQVLQEYY